jgi:formate transporter
MFVFPLAMIVNPDITFFDWWVWNQIPVTIGNIVGAVVFNSVLWYKSHST